MKKIICLAIVLTFVACKEESNTDWLQSGAVQVTKSLLSSSSLIIDSTATISAELRMESVAIFYTNDGSEPDRNSKAYINPIQIEEAGVYKFKAFHPDWNSSETASIELVKKGIDIDSIYWHTPIRKPYPGSGTNTVINHEKGSLNFRDNQWIGLDSVMQADVFFKEPTHIEKINIGYFAGSGSWIFPPEKIEVLISEGGSSFNPLIELELETPSSDIGPESKKVELKVGTSAKAFRIIMNNKKIPEWHPAAGNPGWLFTDEWIFYNE